MLVNSRLMYQDFETGRIGLNYANQIPVTFNGVEHSLNLDMFDKKRIEYDITDISPRSMSAKTNGSETEINEREFADITDNEKSPGEIGSPNSDEDIMAISRSNSDVPVPLPEVLSHIIDDKQNINEKEYGSDGTDSDDSLPDVLIVTIPDIIPSESSQEEQGENQVLEGSGDKSDGLYEIIEPNELVDEIPISTRPSIQSSRFSTSFESILTSSVEIPPISIPVTASVIENEIIQADDLTPRFSSSFTSRSPITILTGLKGSSSSFISHLIQQANSRNICIVSRDIPDQTHPSGVVTSPLLPDMISTFRMFIRNHTKFDSIVLDLTGLSVNHGSVLRSFNNNQDLKLEYEVTSIVTLYEVRSEDFAPFQKISEMIAISNQLIVITSPSTNNNRKSVSQEFLIKLMKESSAISPYVQILRALTNDYPIESILFTNHFDYEYLGSLDLNVLGSSYRLRSSSIPAPSSSSGIRSIGILIYGDLNVIKFNRVINPFFSQYSDRIFKCFGVLGFDSKIQGKIDKFTFIGVRRELKLVRTIKPFLPNEPRCSKLVFVGRDLDIEALVSGLRTCAVDPNVEIEILK
jgi:G3E family GTPase